MQLDTAEITGNNGDSVKHDSHDNEREEIDSIPVIDDDQADGASVLHQGLGQSLATVMGPAQITPHRLHDSPARRRAAGRSNACLLHTTNKHTATNRGS